MAFLAPITQIIRDPTPLRRRPAPTTGWSPRYWPSVLAIASFSQATIIEVFPPIVRSGQVYLSWSTTSPAGTWWQVYINGQLAWHGQRLWTWVPIPSGPVRIDIGTVGTGNELTSFAAMLPSAPSRRARLSWTGGSYGSVAGYRVYGPDAPGGAINYGRILATIGAYPAGIDTTGLGSPSYSWTSDPL